MHTRGDGFLATFDGPACAARFAVAVTQVVRPIGLDVRLGLHTGEVELMGDATGRNPPDRGKRGSKYHLIVDRQGIPLAVQLSTANRHDSCVFESLIEAIPPIVGPRGWPGRPRFRPSKLHADKAYDIPRCRAYLRRRRICIRIARTGVESSERLGRHRWVVERTISWLLGFRRLATRYERRADILTGLLHLACALIALRFLTPEAGV